MSYQQLEMMFSPSSEYSSNKYYKIEKENEELKKRIEVLETKVDLLLDIIKTNK